MPSPNTGFPFGPNFDFATDSPMVYQSQNNPKFSGAYLITEGGNNFITDDSVLLIIE